MMPDVTSDPRTWTAKERTHVFCNRNEWTQMCLDYYEQEKAIRKMVDFVTIKKEEKCSTLTIRGICQKIVSFWTKN